MCNKKVSKSLINQFILAEKEFWAGGNTYDLSVTLSKVLEAITAVNWICWKEIVSAVYRTNGFYHDMEIDKFYEFLNLIGIEATND